MSKKKNKQKTGIPDGTQMKTTNNSDNVITDPFGMYTGIPDDPNERPIQDADDL